MKERIQEYIPFVETDTPPKEYSRKDIANLFSPEEKDYEKLLPNSGFDVTSQVVNFLNSKEDLRTRKDKIDRDLRGFVKEYIEKQPILVNPIQIKNGKVVSIGYGEIPITSYTNKTERKGMAYKEAEIVANFLPNAPDKTIFVSTSPKGTTGEQDFQGKFINHPESQTKIYYKDGNQLKAYTIRTNMTLQENVRFMQSLSKRTNVLDGDYKTEFDAICEVTGTVISRRDLSPQNIIDRIREAKSSDIAWRDKDKQVNFSQMYASLKNIEKLSETNKSVEKILSTLDRRLNKFDKNNLSKKDQKKLAILVGQAVLNIYEKLEGKPTDGKTTAQKVAELGGCAGGGQEKTPTRIVNGKVEYFVRNCPFCGRAIFDWLKIGATCKNSECGKVFKVAC